MRRFFIVCGLAALLVGCSTRDKSFDVPTSNAKIEKVTLSVDPYELSDDFHTRSSLVFNGTEFIFGWTDGDSLGMFPVSPAGSQVYQVLKGKHESGDLSFTFDGGAWTLRPGPNADYRYCRRTRTNIRSNGTSGSHRTSSRASA